MKVIFLDVDGVLNNDLTLDLSPGGWVGVDDTLTERLHRIVEATGAQIVLTSDWKDEWDVSARLRTSDGRYLHGQLAKAGVIIKDKTVDLGYDRGAGIAEYLKTHPDITSWIVIDDTPYPDFGKNGVLPRFIKTMNPLGLTEKHVARAISMLNEGEDGEQ